MPCPYFSIIIPTHERSTLLRRAITSVQTGGFEDYELIVVSDIADRNTMVVAAEMLSSSDTFVKRTGTLGPTSSRNQGLELARGERIIFLDDDDSFQAGYLSAAHRACLQHSGKILYATRFLALEEDRSRTPQSPIKQSEVSVASIPPDTVYVKNFINCNSLIYPTAVVKPKRQDPFLSSLEDWDFLLNAMQDADLLPTDIAGPVNHKDYVNLGNRRGSTEAAQGVIVVSDYLSIYKKCPTPSPTLKQQRQDLMVAAGFRPPLEWL